MIPRLLVPKDAKPLSADPVSNGTGRTSQLLSTSERLCPAGISSGTLDAISNIPSYRPSDVLAARMVVPRDAAGQGAGRHAKCRGPSGRDDTRQAHRRAGRAAECHVAFEGADPRLQAAGRARTGRDDHGRSHADGQAHGRTRLHVEHFRAEWGRAGDSGGVPHALCLGLAETFSKPWADGRAIGTRAGSIDLGEFACIERIAERTEAFASPTRPEASPGSRSAEQLTTDAAPYSLLPNSRNVPLRRIRRSLHFRWHPCLSRRPRRSVRLKLLRLRRHPSPRITD